MISIPNVTGLPFYNGFTRKNFGKNKHRDTIARLSRQAIMLIIA